MILKASERGGAKHLAQHLLRTDDNEHVEMHQLRGFVSDDLTAALKEAYAVSKGTKCKNFLFSLSLSPPADKDVAVSAFEEAIARVETKLGLETHARAIVFHEKDGRRHAHAVWSRIDVETMTARNLPHYKLKLRDISRALYIEHGWKLPRGLMNSKARDPKSFTLAEWQEWKRKGIRTQDVKAVFQECWAASDNRASFANALKERGFALARGDRRGFVAAAADGTVLAIPRYVGVSVKAVRDRLGDPNDLPSVADVQAGQAQDMAQMLHRLLAGLRAANTKAKQRFERQRQAVLIKHRTERQNLDQKLQERQSGEAKLRAAKLKSGLVGLWQRLTGEARRLRDQQAADIWDSLQRDQTQRDNLVAAQLAERRDLQRQVDHARRRLLKDALDLRADRARQRRQIVEIDEERLKARFERQVERKPKRRQRLPSTRPRRRRGPEQPPSHDPS